MELIDQLYERGEQMVEERGIWAPYVLWRFDHPKYRANEMRMRFMKFYLGTNPRAADHERSLEIKDITEQREVHLVALALFISAVEAGDVVL